MYTHERELCDTDFTRTWGSPHLPGLLAMLALTVVLMTPGPRRWIASLVYPTPPIQKDAIFFVVRDSVVRVSGLPGLDTGHQMVFRWYATNELKLGLGWLSGTFPSGTRWSGARASIGGFRLDVSDPPIKTRVLSGQ